MKEKILFIDDDKLLLKAVSRQFRKDFDLVILSDPTKIEETILENEEFSVIVSDMLMPQRKGSEVLKICRELSPHSTRLLLTGESNFQDSIDAVNQGQIFRFLTKPCDASYLKSAIEDGIKQFQLLNVEKSVLDNTLKGSILMMSNIISLLRPDLFSHSLNLRTHALEIAKKLQLKNTWEIEVACLLSHIGCVTLESNLVAKKLNGLQLSPQEVIEFNSQLQISSNMINEIPRMQSIADGIKYMETLPNDPSLNDQDLPVISRILKAVQDYEIQNKKFKNSKKTVAHLSKSSELYDMSYFEFLVNKSNKSPFYFEPKTIPVKDITVGMVIAENLYKGEILLLAKNQEITETMSICIRKLCETSQITGEIDVLQQRRDASIDNL